MIVFYDPTNSMQLINCQIVITNEVSVKNCLSALEELFIKENKSPTVISRTRFARFKSHPNRARIAREVLATSLPFHNDFQ